MEDPHRPAVAGSGQRPLVLLSNDDGVEAAGLRALAEALREAVDVVVCAPETEQSAHSHALTLSRPLRHRDLGGGVHAIDGTPADCIYVALHPASMLPRRPDLVVSGINHGPNLGSDVYYSGTVAAAREGALRGIPAIAFSLEVGGDRVLASRLARDLVLRLLAAPLPERPTALLNVNFPMNRPRGVRATRLGRRLYDDDVVVRQDPRGREYFWIGGPASARHEHIPGSDTEAVDQGFASVTPLSIEGTSADLFGLAAYVAAGGAASESLADAAAPEAS
jgi:5'-nucleotidase